jgi:hypothetical protein
MTDVNRLLDEIAALQTAIDHCQDQARALRLERMLQAREAELADLQRRAR